MIKILWKEKTKNGNENLKTKAKIIEGRRKTSRTTSETYKGQKTAKLIENLERTLKATEILTKLV